jgi:CheY-like chemotaxis protein
MNVLIVDDEPMTRSLLRRVLIREFAATVVEATDGLEALSVAGAKPVNLIVTDLRMPVMDGIELLEALRQFPPLAAIPVVMMTAAREPGPVHRAIELGVTDYLLKPLQADRVAARLRTVIDHIGRAAANHVDPQGRVEVDGQTPVLIADGSADFRHFVASTIGSARVVHQAQSGVAALQKCVESRPGIVFVGSELGVLGPELLVRKLRGLPELASTRIVAVVAKQALDAAPPIAQVDGQIARTFVPEDFRAQFDRMFAPAPKAGGILAEHPGLRVQMASAAEQVFGMMLQLEVAPSFEVEPFRVERLVQATIGFDLPDRTGERLVLAVRTDAPSARLIASRKAGTDEAAVSDPDVAAALGEVAGIIGGRLKTALEDAGVRVAVGSPATSTGGAEDLSGGGEQAVQVTVKTVERGLVFVLQLATAPAVAEPVAAASPEPAAAS